MQITDWFIHADYMLVRYADYRLVHSCRSFPKTAFWPITKKLFWQEISCNTKCYIILLAHLLFIQFWLQFRLFTLIVCFIRHWRKLTFLNHIHICTYVRMLQVDVEIRRLGLGPVLRHHSPQQQGLYPYIFNCYQPLNLCEGGGGCCRPPSLLSFF